MVKMIVSVSKTKSVVRVAMFDALILGVICAVPALSHVLALPLYKMNPMLLCLLVGMLLVKDRRNAFLLALLMPTVSMLVSGMPVPMKALCMTGELLTIVGVMQLMENGKRKTENGERKTESVFLRVLLAILAGKVVYYALKALVIAPVVLIETDVWLQLVVVAVYGVGYGLLKLKIDN